MICQVLHAVLIASTWMISSLHGGVGGGGVKFVIIALWQPCASLSVQLLWIVIVPPPDEWKVSSFFSLFNFGDKVWKVIMVKCSKQDVNRNNKPNWDSLTE